MRALPRSSFLRAPRLREPFAPVRASRNASRPRASCRGATVEQTLPQRRPRGPAHADDPASIFYAATELHLAKSSANPSQCRASCRGGTIEPPL